MTPLVSLPLADTPARVKGCCNALPPPLPQRRADELAAVHRALGDPTRVQLLHILATVGAPACVCDFQAAFDLSQPTISHHLAKLREAGLITSFKRGIWSFYMLAEDMPAAGRAALEAIDQSA